MNDLSKKSAYSPTVLSNRADRPWRIFCVEGLTSAGTNLLVTAIYFYMADRYHWNLKQNFLLACGQGVLYVGGALVAGSFVRRFNHQAALSFVYTIMALLSLAAFFAIRSPIAVAALLLLYSCASAVGWPIIESLASSGVESHALSRRLTIYNTVWSLVSIVSFAGAGSLIAYWPAGIFLVPFAAHSVSAVMMFQSAGAAPTTSPVHPVHTSTATPGAEPELLRERTLALWLSRVALPAAYVVLFSLGALLPSLPVMKGQTQVVQTLLAATWMVARGIAFLALGVTTRWHTRPRLLLVAAIIMLVAFFGITIRPSDIFAHGSVGIDLLTMIVSQLALGAAVGLIYTASLYFGMVLSAGSTEHGGYHEALVGAGFIVGPGAGALAQIVRPGSLYAGIAAVGAVVMISVVAVAITAVLAGRKEKAVQA